ncbi:MAG: hypothetical protein JSU94_13035 [Phycisphaerales bacterium]|nr:MAG: hypothetical protein JSU94_13035 [Phycisphaerales bacterium]
MNTTPVVIEILIIGFQALVWILLAIFSILGHEWIDLSTLKAFALPLSLAGVAVCYTLGTIFDLVGHHLFNPADTWLADLHYPNLVRSRQRAQDHFWKIWIDLMAKANEPFRRAERKNYKQRVLRATTFNIALTGVFSSSWYLKYHFSYQALALCVVLVSGATAGVFLSWIAALFSFYDHLTRFDDTKLPTRPHKSTRKKRRNNRKNP